LFFSLLKLLPQKLRLLLFVSHWLPFNESLAFWKIAHKIAWLKLHPFPHWKSTIVILQMFIHGIWMPFNAWNTIYKWYFLDELYYILRFIRSTSIPLCWLQIHITLKNGYKTNTKFEVKAIQFAPNMSKK
jgi:hypothetical protein